MNGKKNDPVLPDATSDAHLSGDFKDFFWSKVNNLRNELDNTGIALYDCGTTDPPACLDCFVPRSESEVRKVIMDSVATTCDSDPIPTHLLKDS